MEPLSPEQQYEQAQKTREMVALVQRFLVGGASRQELVAWVHRTFGNDLREAFIGNAPAGALLTCMASLDAPRHPSPEPLVRATDIAQLLRAVLIGEPQFDPREVAGLTRTAAELATQTGGTTARMVIDGLGWLECLRFASPATGRAFVAGTLLDGPQPTRASVHTVALPDTAEAQALVLADLFDTLGIDLDDTVSACAAPPRRWELMRTDDNGNHAVVARLSGYAKARALLAEYEARGHKQTYWLEPRD